MKQDWLDKGLDDKLGDYDAPMDLENAWESFQTRRQAPPRKKNRFFFFWIIFGLLTIGVGGSYLFFNNKTDNTHTNTITELEHNQKNENQVSGKTEMSSFTLSNSENINLQNSNINTATETKTILNKTKNKSFENQNYSNSKNAKTNVNSTTLFSDVKNNDVDNIITSDSNLDFSKKTNKNFIFPKENKEEEKNSIVIDSASYQKGIQPIATLFLPSLETNLLNLSPQEEYEILDASYAVLPVVNSFTSAVPNYFGIVGGYGIHSKGQVLPQENSLDAITVNAFYEHRFGNSNWYFKTGVNYNQFIKKLERTSEQSFTQEQNDQLITVNHFQNGTTQNVFGMAEVKKVERTTSKNFNRYRLISIPLMLGYDLISINRASLQLEAGVARSILAFHSGKDFDLVDSNFEKQGVWQGVYGLNFNIKTGTRTNIFTSLRGNYHFNKIGKSDQLDIEKFRLHQVQIGLRFKL